jgi:hypothetical protein
VAERSCRHQIRTVGKGWSEHGREIAVTYREFLRQIVIEGNLVLVIEVHGLIPIAFGHFIHAHEAVGEKAIQSLVGVEEIRFFVGAQPAVVQVRQHAASGIVEGEHSPAFVVDIRIRATEVFRWIDCAGQAVDTLMITFCARAIAIVIGTAGREGQNTEIVVERMVFLHHHNDVIHLV